MNVFRKRPLSVQKLITAFQAIGFVDMETLKYITFKRYLDVIFSAAALAGLLPFLVALAGIVYSFDGLPVLFRQLRIGRCGKPFFIYKYRTMRVVKGTESGSFDVGCGARVTRCGKALRKLKLDELPQLWNVFKGDMSLVGPRPEVPQWIAVYPERWARVLQVTPGITDLASVTFRNEESLLEEQLDPTIYYRQVQLPHKLDLYEAYIENISLSKDIEILARTVTALIKA